MKPVLLLAGLGLGMWLLAVGPAYLFLGDLAVLQSAVAGALCLVPALATLAWANVALRQSSEMQLLAVLGGSGVRLVLILSVGTFLFFQYPETFTVSFWVWVGAFYLALLAMEIAFIVHPAKPISGNEAKTS